MAAGRSRMLFCLIMCTIFWLLPCTEDADPSFIARLENSMAPPHWRCFYESRKALASLNPMQTLKIFIEHLQWKRFAFVSDSEENWSAISENFPHSYVQTVLYNPSPERALMGWLGAISEAGSLHSRNTTNVVVMCSRLCLTRIFQEADDYDAQNKAGSGVWITWRWFVLAGPSESPDVTSWSVSTAMSNVAIYFQNTAQENSTTRRLRLVYTLVWKPEGRQLSVTASLSFNERGEYSVYGEIFANEKYGFNGRQFVFATKKWTYYMFEEIVNGTKVWKGLYMDVLEYLQKRLNFSYILKESSDDSWGVGNTTGYWNGVLGMVVSKVSMQAASKEADVGWVPFEVTSERSSRVDFSSPSHYTTTTFIYKPPAVDRRWVLLVKPFTWQVYTCIMGSMVLTTLLLFLAKRALRMQHEARAVTLQSCVFVVMGLDGADGEVQYGAGRVVLATWCLVAMVIGAAYSGSLVADLSVTRSQTLFRSLEDVVSQDAYKWGTLKDSSTHVFIMRSSLPVFQKTQEGLERFSRDDPTVLSDDDEIHFQKVVEERYVFLGLRNTLEAWARRDCSLVVGNESLKFSLVAPVFPKGSPLTDYFSKALEDLRAHGLLEAWTRKWLPEASCTPESRKLVPISLRHVQVAFYSAVCGLGASTFAFLTELGCSWRERRREL